MKTFLNNVSCRIVLNFVITFLVIFNKYFILFSRHHCIPLSTPRSGSPFWSFSSSIPLTRTIPPTRTSSSSPIFSTPSQECSCSTTSPVSMPRSGSWKATSCWSTSKVPTPSSTTPFQFFPSVSDWSRQLQWKKQMDITREIMICAVYISTMYGIQNV